MSWAGFRVISGEHLPRQQVDMGVELVRFSRFDGPIEPTSAVRQIPAWFELSQQTLRTRLGPDCANWATLQLFVHELACDFSTFVLTDRLPPEQITERTTCVFERPATWWDHFKQTYADRWWLRWHIAKRPAAMTAEERPVELVVNLDRFLSYPKSRTGHELRGLGNAEVRGHQVRTQWRGDGRLRAA